MAPRTPFLATDESLPPLASRYVSVAALPWQKTPAPGIEMKILLEDKESGLLTALFRWQPGTRLPLHEHVDIEQTYVLEGRILDDEGEARAGDYVWRPRGNATSRMRPTALSSSRCSCGPTSSSKARRATDPAQSARGGASAMPTPSPANRSAGASSAWSLTAMPPTPAAPPTV
jgi:hypothetical protein